MSWGQDGTILVGSVAGGVFSIPAEGGVPREITSVDPTREAEHQLPWMLPGNEAFLLTTILHEYDVRARVEAFSLPSKERTVVVEDGADARYLPSGHLVFVRQAVLMAAPFDLARLELAAPPVPVIQDVSQALGRGSAAAQFAVSESGLLVYAQGGIHQNTPVELLLADEAGRLETLAGFDRPFISPQLHFSPDGRQLAFVQQAPNGLLWLFDVERRTYRAFSDSGLAASPRWSPDGTRLALGWSEAGPFHLWLVPTVRGDWQQLTDGDRHDWAPSWSPDGRVLAFVRGDWTACDIFLYRFDENQVAPFLTTPKNETHPEFSPDGRWLAYASNESGRFEVYVTSFPDRDKTFTVSRAGGTAPAWSSDGSTLFYYSLLSPDGRHSMMAVTVQSGTELLLGPPTPLFQLPDGFMDLGPMRNYELHLDGRRFLIGRVVETEPEPPITRLHVVHNWFEELKRLAPVE